MQNQYFEANKSLWNKKTPIHLTSDFYDVAGFKKGKTSLNDIELALLGDVKGKKILHLQCHFGQDTLSLARMGAEVTGIDLSDEAIKTAKALAKELDLPAKFVCCNVYDIDQHLDEQYDLIFTTYGVIGWLPDLEPWAKLVNQFLKPGGQFLLVEFHPVVWMFDDNFQRFDYSYFNTELIEDEEEGTYADKNAPIKEKAYCWNHGLADVFTSLLNQGLKVEVFEEHDYSPYDCFNKTVAVEKGYQIQGLENKLPMVYALKMTKGL